MTARIEPCLIIGGILFFMTARTKPCPEDILLFVTARTMPCLMGILLFVTARTVLCPMGILFLVLARTEPGVWKGKPAAEL